MTIKINSIADIEKLHASELYKYLKEKELCELSIEELAYIHLNLDFSWTISEDLTISSSLTDLIVNARRSFSNVATKQYTPVLVCFSILDQLGSIYKVKGIKSSKENCIKQFLEYFGEYSQKEINALVSLRNGLCHDGSLLNISRHKNNPHTIFRFNPKLDKTIQLCVKEWNGQFEDEMTSYVSYLNLKFFFEDVCKMIKICKKKLIANELDLKINDPREFYYKFLFGRRYTKSDFHTI